MRTGAVSVTIFPSQAMVDSGASLQFKAQVVGAANVAVIWTAVLGSVSPSGLYTAPNVKSSTVDSVSAISVADPHKYVTIEIAVEGSRSESRATGISTTTINNNSVSYSTTGLQSQQIYTLVSQQPATLVPYANNSRSITSKRLPANVMSHLYTSPQGVSGHDIAVCAFTNCGDHRYMPGGSLYGLMGLSSPGGSDLGPPFYYATVNDPWYKLTGCALSSLNGLTFHAPNQAQYNNASSDNQIYIWDQANDYLLVFYTYASPGTKLPLSTCPGTGPSSCAVAWNHSGNNYCAVEKYHNERDWGWARIPASLGGGDTLVPGVQLSNFAGIVRQQELMQGVIPHAIKIVDACHNPNNPLVFPGTSSTDVGAKCDTSSHYGSNVPQRPPGGALLFLDYSDAEINSMNLPTWQKAYITALAHYGAYIGVTGGQSGYVPFANNNLEGSQAWAYAGLTNPFYAWLTAQPGISHFTHADGSIGYGGHVFDNIPTVRGRNVLGHMYMADPCVVKTLAGVPGGC